jgi:hypothetical protein
VYLPLPSQCCQESHPYRLCSANIL